MNFHTPHLLILAEDEHDLRLANGFAGHLKVDRRKIKLTPVNAVAANGGLTWQHSSLQHNQAELQRF
jgi:hypothetical protein